MWDTIRISDVYKILLVFVILEVMGLILPMEQHSHLLLLIICTYSIVGYFKD